MTATATQTHTVKCLRCHRRITSPASIATGYGTGCLRKIRKAAVSGRLAKFSPRQVADAVELIEDGGVVPLRRRIYLTVGGKGEVYRTATTGNCNCPAGLRGTSPCYHAAAVALIAA